MTLTCIRPEKQLLPSFDRCMTLKDPLMYDRDDHRWSVVGARRIREGLEEEDGMEVDQHASDGVLSHRPCLANHDNVDQLHTTMVQVQSVTSQCKQLNASLQDNIQENTGNYYEHYSDYNILKQ